MVLKFHAPFCNIELALTKYRALTRKPSSHGACIMMGHMDPQAELRLAPHFTPVSKVLHASALSLATVDN